MRTIALLPLVFLLGCTPSIQDNRFTCERDEECPRGGFRCAAGLCTRANPGTLDSGVDAALRVDAGFVDTGSVPDAFAGFDAFVGCDPERNTGCSRAACVLNAVGIPRCGMAGTLSVGSRCVVGGSECTPGAVCANAECRQVCAIGSSCGAAACTELVAGSGSRWGYCPG